MTSRPGISNYFSFLFGKARALLSGRSISICTSMVFVQIASALQRRCIMVLWITESKTNLHQLPMSIMNFVSLLKPGILFTALAL